MQLTIHTDYAFRTLICLGLSPGERVTVGEIADRYDISRHHLVKVANHLGSAGLVRSVRGRHGGLILGRPPESIRLSEVARLTEEHFTLAECFKSGHVHCRIASNCRLHPILNQALAAFLDVLDRYTLADLLSDRTHLAMSLGIAPMGEAPAGGPP